jgi:hypothetical protein
MKQPSAHLERLVGSFLPRDYREHVLGDFSERFRSPAQYLWDASARRMNSETFL